MMTGGCLCGRVRYELSGAPFNATICHCRSCRRAAGAASVAWFSVKSDVFAFTAAAPSAFRSSRTVTRTFCGTCGSALTYQRDDTPDEIDITIATLAEPDIVVPEDHTYAAEKLAWDEICDGRPVHDETRPA